MMQMVWIAVSYNPLLRGSLPLLPYTAHRSMVACPTRNWTAGDAVPLSNASGVAAVASGQPPQSPPSSGASSLWSTTV